MQKVNHPIGRNIEPHQLLSDTTCSDSHKKGVPMKLVWIARVGLML